MERIVKSDIEEFAIELLEKRGYQYLYCADTAPDSTISERQFFEEILLFPNDECNPHKYSG